ncbi:lytic transglycosylase domain-containing protein [Candidatus Poribacteria bacterium]|nr:lytic transglycosylase domain-containing protein [Candidatus Poribacteria bacterium]
MKNQLSILPYRKWCLLLVATVFLVFTYFLGQKNTLSDPLDLRPEVGTRGIGLGGAFIGSADDATSPLWNPAGLAALQHGNLIYDLSQGAISLAYPIQPIGTLGINVLDLNANDRFLLNHVANPIGSFELGNNQALLSCARKFGPLQIGASTGLSRAPYHGSLWAPNYDVGLLAEINAHLTLGMRLRDIAGVTIRHTDGHVLQAFNQQVAIGAVFTPHPIIRWHNRFDISPAYFGTSIEIGNRAIAAHVGSTFTLDDELPFQSWRVGFSLNQLGKELHYTYLNQENLEYRHLVSIGMSFGETQFISQGTQINRQEEKNNTIASKTPTSIPMPAIVTQKPELKDEPSTPTSDTFQKLPPKTEIETQQAEQTEVAYLSVQIATEYDIDLPLMLAIIHAESNFNPIAVSKNGAGGLMQMMPATARELGLKVPQYQNKRTPTLNANIDERFDPHKNLHAGLTYFKMLLEKYRGNLTLALGAYNVGPGRVAVNGPLISRGKQYANKVLNRSRYYRENKTKMEEDLKRLEAVLKPRDRR